jgi:23S rRNA (cytosine1962-C5)-methyltransferase
MRFFDDSKKPIYLTLKHDVRWALQRGFPWIYAPAVTIPPQATAGDFALLKDGRGTIVAKGFCDPDSHLAFRVLTVERPPFTQDTVVERLQHASELRSAIIPPDTNAYRLVNGEGDFLPGLVIDQYTDTAVIKGDGPGPTAFWNADGIAEWLVKNRGVTTVYARTRGSRDDDTSRLLVGVPTSPEVEITEWGHRFLVNVQCGQKTGFFLDQRDNRQRIGALSSNRRVLNLFGYTGGFSVYAGKGGAHEVDTIDIATPAIELAQRNWELNNLPPQRHRGIVADVFTFLEEAKGVRRQWDLIVVDPPAFVHKSSQVDAALAAYERLFTHACAVAAPRCVIAFASCSSKVTIEAFQSTIQQALSATRRRARTLGIYGQPQDHPYPFACEDLQYLRFILLELD